MPDICCRWEGPRAAEDQKQQVMGEIASAVSKEITAWSSRRLRNEPSRAWRDAYAQAGTWIDVHSSSYHLGRHL